MIPLRALAIAVAAALPLAALADTFRAVVSHVTDGDSVWVRPEGGGPPRQVRLEGIDAPEICQPFGRESRDALAEHVLHRHVAVLTRGQDDYQRLVARLHIGRADVGKWMVAHGYAWSYRFRGDPGPYRREEARAHGRRLGLWTEVDAEPPRDFRVRHGSCRTTP